LGTRPGPCRTTAGGQPAEQREADQAEREQADDALDDVLVLEVAQLVRQHGVDLAGRQLGQQRVEEHHALGRAEAGEVGIGVRAALAAVHHEQALGREAAALHQRRDARLAASRLPAAGTC
jgi:hypothetical protein